MLWWSLNSEGLRDFNFCPTNLEIFFMPIRLIAALFLFDPMNLTPGEGASCVVWNFSFPASLRELLCCAFQGWEGKAENSNSLRYGLCANHAIFKEIDNSHWFLQKLLCMQFGICSLFHVAATAYLVEGYPHHLTSQWRPCSFPCSESYGNTSGPAQPSLANRERQP